MYTFIMGSREVLKLLTTAGWVIRHSTGSHHQLTHPSRPGRVTVPHPVKDLAIGTLKSIEKQSGMKLR